MHSRSILLLGVAAMVWGNPALAQKQTFESNVKVERDEKGNYTQREKTKRIDAAGTATTSEKKITVELDRDGNANRKTVIREVTDPKGLGNRHVATSTDIEKVKNGEVTESHKTTIGGKAEDGTRDNYRAERKISQDAQGNYKERDKVTNTDSEGTKVSYEKKATVSVDEQGKADKKTTTKSVVDPKGLRNKTTVTTSNTEDTGGGMVKSNQTIKVDGETVQDVTQTVPLP